MRKNENEIFEYIDQKQIADAKLFSDRFTASDIIPKGGLYLEVGVGGGDYAEWSIPIQNPERSDFIDFFDQPCVRYDRWTSENHHEYVIEKFKNKNIQTFRGNSLDILKTLNDKYRYIYLDTNHSFDHVYKELSLASLLLEDNGVIGINDYTHYGYFEQEELGCLYAVNLFLKENPKWKVIGFALGYCGYSDIYITKVN